MLGDHPITPVLLATDMAQARAFYHEALGLEILAERDGSIDFRCRPGVLNLNLRTTGTADTQTQAGWRVDDLRAELAELRDRGVDIQEYDLPGLKTESGIADIGFAWAAWIVDPFGNALGILQAKT